MQLSTTILKYGLLLFIIAIDAAVSTLIFLYGKYYWYLPIVAMGSTQRVLLIVIGWIFQMFKRLKRCCRKRRDMSQQILPDTGVGFVIPCYTENDKLLSATLTSLKDSIYVCNDKYKIKPIIFVIVDGKNRGLYNEHPTYKYMEQLLEVTNKLTLTYTSWKREKVTVDVSYGTYHDIKYVLLVKNTNQSKKDSLILIRKIIKYLNENDMSIEKRTASLKFNLPNESFNMRLVDIIKRELGISSIEYLFGTDAGTHVGQLTPHRLLKSIIKNENIMGVSGFVRVDTYDPQTKYKWLVIYQTFEYIIQQVITRAGQSIFRHVTCLPGCVQLFRMHDNCIGDTINKFEEVPKDNMFSKIRAYLGEDRRYTCLIQYARPNSRMKMNTHADVYTDVPSTLSVFLSQRRRWFLSSNANNISDVMSSSLPIFVRFIAFVQLWGSLFVLTNAVCLARIVMFIIQGRVWYTLLVLFSAYIFISLYKCLIAIIYSESLGDLAYYLFSMIIFLFASVPLNVAIIFNAILTMDDFSWGKTQPIDKTENMIRVVGNEINNETAKVMNIKQNNDVKMNDDMVEFAIHITD